jgi:hypothetical protein
MREGSPNQVSAIDAQFEAKSLFQNILAASPCDSRFCIDDTIPNRRKSSETNILARRYEKN